MIGLNLYLYDSTQTDYKGADLTKYLAQGNSYTEDISQELDVGEITLYGYPEQKEFDPNTKFIYEIWENNELKETIHLVCDKDMVSMPQLSDSEYYDHHITMIEPSVIAQKRVVDNISCTYKLKDVTLNEQSAVDVNAISYTSFEENSNTDALDVNFGYTFISGTIQNPTSYAINTFGKCFKLNGAVLVETMDQTTSSQHLYQDIDNYGQYPMCRFILPHLELWGGVNGTKNFQYVGDVSIDYTINRYDGLNAEPYLIYKGSILSNDNISNASNMTNMPMPNFINEWAIEDIGTEVYGIQATTHFQYYFKRYTDTSRPEPDYHTVAFSVQSGFTYEVVITVHEFKDNIPSSYSGLYDYHKYTGSDMVKILKFIEERPNYIVNPNLIYYRTERVPLTYQNTTAISNYIFYKQDELRQIIYASGTPYSALDLLKKAIINSANYYKKDDISIFDIDNNDYPFYIDPNYVNELAITPVIENFYNQKNLWEIMLEVGYYIHAVPEIRFGEDDKFLITFNKLGRTDLQTNKNTKQSIYNFRGIEDYISACSSYVNNMVQLGGEITEWVAPKTSSETFLIANDTCNIQVCKPIIELINITAKKVDNNGGDTIPVGTEIDITNLVFEKNIYDTLSIDKNIFVNKGVSLYYNLGSNKIEGCQYQLPTINSGDVYNDYAIKKVIWSAYGGYSGTITTPTASWTDIKVNDFIFKITYRTKDNVRLQSTRPDLRKYLLSSKYDAVPQQVQFNNQQDILVDSVKFGNNVYGKLIRTGNTNYKVAEWSRGYNELKHKGELYEINGDLYYVAKVKHTIFSTHIISDVEYAKDYNQLSQVVGIPSEPRFYEISEQSSIRRDVSINDYFMVATRQSLHIHSHITDEWDRGLTSIEYISHLMFNENTDFPKYMLLTFKGDKDMSLFENVIGDYSFRKDILLPINAYSSGTTLTFEVDCIDNYGAGDKVITSVKSGYNSLLAERYTDKYGKSALLDYYILDNVDLLDGGNDQQENVMALPESPITTDENDTSKPHISTYISSVYATNEPSGALALIKDNREAISIDYNLQMLTDSDLFVVSPFTFTPNKTNVKVVLLNKEVNKLTNGYIDTASIITTFNNQDVENNSLWDLSMIQYTNLNRFGEDVVVSEEINFEVIRANTKNEHFIEQSDTRYQRVKAIAIIFGDSISEEMNTDIYGKAQFVVARNIPTNYTKEEALKNWELGIPNMDFVNRTRQ